MKDDQKGNPWKSSAGRDSKSEGGYRNPRSPRRPRGPRGSGRDDRRFRRDDGPDGSPRQGGFEDAPKKRPVIRREGDQWLEPVCGFHAVGSLFYAKPFIVERLFFDAESAPMLGDICKFLAKEKKPYRQVDAVELAKVSGTRHHGGVVAIARRRLPEVATPKAAEFWAKEGMPLLILDGVANTHNFGGLARTAAFYGVEKLLIADSKRQARPSESAYRVARGGLDLVDLRLVDNVPSFLKAVRTSHLTIGLDIEGLPLPELAAICPEEQEGKPVAIVIGNEETGLGEGTKEACDLLVGIPGSGAIDRLNVVAEAALLLQRYVVEAY
ncbi:RNA methyltransferase [Pelagicoccus sp. SDUM812003]|uniref:TrmH family RNA methyltransferase n=1 Tax=Pelagicoccus sp. SDUM812003 TaxID=3041267 RepID=UPI00280FE40E|nr:RNA methyltransferase [Pelagicoccus sp. SDUM812003]MDQ8201701.1 RNA methyltransferase [Pelagicoccus sp. SDUM812003]